MTRVEGTIIWTHNNKVIPMAWNSPEEFHDAIYYLKESGYAVKADMREPSGWTIWVTKTGREDEVV
jgi:hypothetical protein